MREFFRGWKRTSGICTLSITLLYYGGWFRSVIVRDEINLQLQGHWHRQLVSQEGSLIWCKYSIPVTGTKFDAYNYPITLSSVYVSVYLDSSPILEDTLIWHWKWIGFEYGSGTTHVAGVTAQAWMIPYWAIAFPLSILSAALLLSKQRSSILRTSFISTAN